jgi:heterodisulfide reductase subunit B
MKFALFYGCNIPARLPQYADATEAVLAQLDIELIEVTDFNCCGYPARNTDYRAFILSAARNLALAKRSGLDMLVMCKCCYGSLKKAQYDLNRDQDLSKEINRYLANENLRYENDINVNHLLSVLYHDVGLERLQRCIAHTYNGLQIAVSYGCHALRPSNITNFDDPVSPRIFDELVEITGAFSVQWARKLDCCGAPLTGINDRLSRKMVHNKISSARESGAHFICTACPFTHLQFDEIQHRLGSHTNGQQPLAPVLYPQLLGLCMGIDQNLLGIGVNQTDLSDITSFLMVE